MKIICSECKNYHTCEVKYDVTDIFDEKPVFVPSLACPVLRPDLMKIGVDKPVICAECRDTGRIATLKDGRHLTCHLMNDRPIYGSMPSWCPKRGNKCE